MSYLKHMPIGPTMAVGDVQTDGMVHIHTHNQNPRTPRTDCQNAGTTIDKVVVHIYPGPVTTEDDGGNAGAEDEAYCFASRGKPVRVQWMRSDDVQWSTSRRLPSPMSSWRRR